MKNKILLLMGMALLSLNTIAQVPSYVPSNGLVGYWPFTGNANDLSTNANNGTVNGATLTTDRFGNSNSAYIFNGVSKIVCNVANLPVSNTPRTISAWVKWNALKAIWDNRIVNYGSCPTNSNNGSFGLDLWDTSGNGNPTNSKVVLYGCGVGDIISTNVLDTNWHQILGTYDGFTSKLYIDNVLVQIANRSLNTILSQLVIGANENLSVNNGNFNGIIDDIGIWNRALTQDEITNLYNANICYSNITVTDTLVINLGILGYNPVTYTNSITIYPNPAKDHITIDCGTLANVTGYQIKIANTLGQEVFNTKLNQQQYSIPLNSWTGKGIYFVRVYDNNSNLLTTRKIELQ